jgi:osmotically-inducible protein OsmY
VTVTACFWRTGSRDNRRLRCSEAVVARGAVRIGYHGDWADNPCDQLVTIKGDVGTPAEKQKVGQMTQSMQNVKDVVNSLEVKPDNRKK